MTFTWDVNLSIPQVLDDEDFRYVYGIGRIAQLSGSGTHYYLSDGLGSTMALTDADGDVVNTYHYDVFGDLRDSTGSQDNEFTFAGEQTDPSTDFQYLRARYYDPEIGRFISRDKNPGLRGLPATQNRYAYSLNNPVLYSDPNGDHPICIALVFTPGGPAASVSCLLFVAVVLSGGCAVTDCLNSDSFRDAVESLVALFDKAFGQEEEGEKAPNYEGGFDAPNVDFGEGSGHHQANREAVARRGLDPEAVEDAIRRDILEKGAPPVNSSYPRGQQPTVNVDGVDIEYRPYTLPNGRVNVGSYTPLN